MKKLVFAVALSLTATFAFAQKYDSFGEKIKPAGAAEVSVLNNVSETKQSDVKVEAEVESVCQAKGCWMKVKLADGNTMRVTFKDYGFFVPKDISGKKIIFEGTPEVTTTSVDEQRHYAQDAGKSKEEIAKITEPKRELTFVAKGVLVPKK
jgi:hypothetical protein